ncbi:hypothetical protein J6590_024536 [Homalodisca vitripennis]|nr:hypothetical protein J6590_024536 [Homalodisca vitripennis]
MTSLSTLLSRLAPVSHPAQFRKRAKERKKRSSKSFLPCYRHVLMLTTRSGKVNKKIYHHVYQHHRKVPIKTTKMVQMVFSNQALRLLRLTFLHPDNGESKVIASGGRDCRA